MVHQDSVTFECRETELHVSFYSDKLTLFNIDEISRTYNAYMAEHIADCSAIIVSMGNLTTIDSSSVAFLVRAHLQAKKNRKQFVLKDIPPNIRKILDFANLLNDFEVH